MRLLHAAARTHAAFDEENLVAYAGLVPVMRLAQRCGLADLVGEHVGVAGPLGANTPLKIASLVAGMVAGADSIDDLDVVRHGGMPALFGGVRAPSTLGSFLRCLPWGNVRQLEKVNRLLLGRLAAHTPLLPGAEEVAFVDIDSTQKRLYGPGKQGVVFGHAKIQGRNVLVRGLNALAGTLSTPLAAPVVTGTRLRGGNAGSARAAASFVTEQVTTARQTGASGALVVRADSAFYSAAVAGACTRAGACFSLTVRMDSKVKTAIAGIDDDAWQPIKYPNAIWDDQLDQWISDAEIAETRYTAFRSKKGQAITARLIVRRVKDRAVRQDELFPVWRYHAVFTNSPFVLPQAETHHRGHAIIEQVFADLFDGPLAHLPSGKFAANAAWLTLAAIAHNLARACGCLASTFHAKARGVTLRRHLIAVPARTARHGRGHLTLHLPERWPWADAWTGLFEATHRAPPTQAA